MRYRPSRRSLFLAASVVLAGYSANQQERATSSGASEAPDTAGIPAAPPDPGRNPAADANVPGPLAAPSPADSPRGAGTVPEHVLSRDEVTRIYSGRTERYWGLEAPGVVSRLPSTAAGVALTFDFCGGPGGSGADLALLSALREQQVPATLFLNSRWVTANQAVANDLASDPLFEIANHGTSHSPLSVSGRSAYGTPGTRNPAEVYDEIMTNQARLTILTGKRPRFFRPGTAYLDDVSAEIVRSLGLIPVGFSINGDGGATFPATMVTREISRARAGDIVISHGNHPGSGTAPGLMRALTAMKDRGETFLSLAHTISA